MDDEIRILHTSDVHLDATFRASGLPSARARERCAAHLEAFDHVAAETRRLAAHLLFIAGDLFEGAHARPATVRHVARALEGCGARVFISPGNHDPLLEPSVYGLVPWPTNVHVFGPLWEAVSLPDLDLVVHGRGFGESEERARLVEGLVVSGPGRHVLVAHGSDESNRPDRHDPYRPFLPEELDAFPLLYAALGHFHRFGELPTRRVRALYCGSPIPQGFADQGDHGIVFVRLQGTTVEVERLPLPGRRFVTLQVDVSGADTQAELLRRLQETLEGKGLGRDFLRLRLQGSLPPDFEMDREALREDLRSLAHELEVRDETVPEYDLETLSLEGTVRGHFVRALLERQQAAPEGQREEILQALHYGLDAFAGRPQRR
jgi:DNA repair exonuclease SbcCD nuclease subunit